MNSNYPIQFQARKCFACSRFRVPGVSLGFSLIELMIVIVLIAIIAAIAFPSYQESIRKSRRTLAKTALLDLVSQEEKYYSLNNAYASLATLGISSSVTDSSGRSFYTLSVGDITTPENGPSTDFIATATPTGDQSNDTLCGEYTVNSLGQQTPTTSGCW